MIGISELWRRRSRNSAEKKYREGVERERERGVYINVGELVGRGITLEAKEEKQKEINNSV